LPADRLGGRHRHCRRIVEVEPGCEVERHQAVVAAFGGRVQQTGGIGLLPGAIALDLIRSLR
jgi:hypothetical protein